MDKEIKDMLNMILEEMGRTEERINARFDSVQNRLDQLQTDMNLLKARNDFTDLYALYNQLDKRITEIEKKIS